MVEAAFFMLYPSGCAYLSAEIYMEPLASKRL